jgi:integrase/recombinase XerD
MTALAPHLAAFLREHLPHERMASPHTCATYAYSFQLLVCFAACRLNVKPCQLEIEQLDAPLVLAFLKHIESERHNSARTRNARLAAVNSLFRFLEYRLPSCLDQSRRIHAIPMKKTDEALIGYLTREEMQALINAPDPHTKFGIRDRAMLHLAFAAGLRVSELISIRLDHLDGLAWSSIHVMGKGQRERVLPLWKDTARALRAWLAIRPRDGCPELFPNAAGRAMTRSGFEYILAKHVAAAAQVQPSIAKKRVTPHVLRHSCACIAASDARRSEGLALARPCQPSEHRDLPARRSDGKARSAYCDRAAVAAAGPIPGSRQAHRNAEDYRRLKKLCRVEAVV